MLKICLAILLHFVICKSVTAKEGKKISTRTVVDNKKIAPNPTPHQQNNSFVNNVSITADNIEAYGGALRQSMNPQNVQNPKSHKNLEIKATSNVFIKTDDGDTIFSDKLKMSTQSQTAEITGNVKLNLKSAEMLKNTGGYNIDLESDNLMVRDSLNTFSANLPHLVFTKENASLYINSTNLERSNEIFTLSHPIISGCDFEKCGRNKILPWSFKASQATLNTKTQVLEMKHFRFRLYNIPIFYLPITRANLKKEESYLKNQQIILIGNQTGFSFSIKEPSREKTFGYSLTPTIELYATTPINTVLNTLYNKKPNQPIVQKRMNNIGFVIRKDNDNESLTIATKYAQDYIPNLKTTNVANDAVKQDRYYFKVNGFYKADDNKRFDYSLNAISDIFFTAKYDNVAMTPYYNNNFSYQNKNNSGSSFYQISANTFTNVLLLKSMSSSMTPRILPALRYTKTFFDNELDGFKFIKFKKGDKLTFNTQTMSIYRDVGLNIQRLHNDIVFSRNINNGKYRLFSIDGFISNTFYYYQKSLNQIQANIDAVNLDNKTPSINYGELRLRSSVPFIKIAKYASITLEPKIAIFYNPFTTNKNGVYNEDSASGFLQSFNIFNSTQFSGLDVVEDGLRGAAGLEANVHLLNTELTDTSFVFSLAKRYSKYNSTPFNKNAYFLQTGLSGYVVDFGFNIKNFFIKHKEVKSEGWGLNKPNLLTSNELGLRFKYFDFTFLNSGISQQIFNYTITNNINNKMYSIAFKPIKNYSLSLSRSQSSILNVNKDTSVMDIVSLSYIGKCLNYSVGIEKIKNTNNPSQPSTQFIFSFNLLI